MPMIEWLNTQEVWNSVHLHLLKSDTMSMEDWHNFLERKIQSPMKSEIVEESVQCPLKGDMMLIEEWHSVYEKNDTISIEVW